MPAAIHVIHDDRTEVLRLCARQTRFMVYRKGSAAIQLRVRGMVRGFAVVNLIHNSGAEGASYPSDLAQQTFDRVHTDLFSDTLRTQLGSPTIKTFQPA